jgi:hypothetical protein
MSPHRRSGILPLVLVALATCARPSDDELPRPASLAAAPLPPDALAFLTYHFDAARTGWSDAENVLVPSRVRGGLAVAPLYLDDVTMTGGPLAGTPSSVVFAATA